MKTLKFSPWLPELILAWEKFTTFRINDDKDFIEGEWVSLLARPELFEFAVARITSVKTTRFWLLTKEDWEWHEKFATMQDMYDTYSKYYNKEVNENTFLNVIKFTLI